MDFKQLRTFRTAARTLNFSATANQLSYVQSAVTAHIRALENQLNVRLFDRNGRGVQLTSAGEQLLQYADQLFALREEAEQSVRQSNRVTGELTIAGYETVLTYRLPVILRAFANSFPDVRLNIVSLNVRQMYSQVLNHQIDVAFVLARDTFASGLERTLLAEESVVVVAHPEHPLSRKKQVMATDLRDETILLTEPGCSYRKLFEETLAASGIYPGCQMEFVSIEAIKACIKLGMGIAAVSKASVEKELEDGELVALDWHEANLSIGLYMVWNKKRWASPALTAFLNQARSAIWPGATDH